LNLADNDMGDNGLLALTEVLAGNTTLKHLVLDRNFEKRTASRTKAMNSLADLIATKCKIEMLSIAGSHGRHLKEDMIHFLLSLLTNENLTYLDISNNNGGNDIALAVSKVIQTNNSLKTIVWDGNGITLPGFQAIKFGLKRNKALTTIPHPDVDLLDCKKEERVAVLEVLKEIDQMLLMNIRGIYTTALVQATKRKSRGIDTMKANQIFASPTEFLPRSSSFLNVSEGSTTEGEPETKPRRSSNGKKSRKHSGSEIKGNSSTEDPNPIIEAPKSTDNSESKVLFVLHLPPIRDRASMTVTL